MSSSKENREENITECIRFENRAYIPLDEIIRICRKYGRLQARDIASSLEKASVSENMRVIEEK